MATISGKLTTTYTLSPTDPNLTILMGALVQTSSDGVDGLSGAAWNVTNDGTVTSSNGYGVYLAGPNSIVFDYGSITGLCAVALYGGGTVNNQVGATITSTGSPAASIDAVSGIHIANGTGTVTNAGTITALGYGVGLDKGGTVTNASTGSITGGEDGVFFWGSPGYFYNYGQVTATVDDGVGFFAGGTMVNEVGGSVNATSGSGAAAVYFQSVAGSLQNDGSMIGTVAGAYFTGGGSVVNGANNAAALLQGNSYGVYISGGAGTVVNAGTISGGSYSVDFATNSTANLLVVDPGAVFKGIVAGGTGTLQLASGVGAITGISSAGTFRNFQTLAVNAGGTWTLGGAGNTIANLTDNGALIVTGSLKVSTAVNSSSSGLIQIGAASASGTLEVASEVGSLSQTSFVGNSKLIIDNAASFGTNVGTSAYVGPLLENFQTGDVIDFLNFASSGATISYNPATGLAQMSNGRQTATLDFQTSTLGSGALQIASDGGTGVIVTMSAAAGPVLAGAGNTASYTQGGAAVAVDGALTVSDAGSATLSGATIAITTGFRPGDQLNFANQNGITGSYNASTGLLTLSGSATLATYQAALDSITYSSTNIDPTNGGTDPTRTVTWNVSAGATNSAPVASTIGVTAVAPVLAGAGNTASYTQGGAAVAVDSALSVSDAGSTTLTGATVAITTGFRAGDILNFANQNGISGSYNASTGVLTLSGSAALATYQAALDSITYSSANIDPTNGGTDPTRTVTWSVSAGATSSAPVTSTMGVTAVAPVLAGAGNTASYTQGGAAVAVDSALSVSDAGSSTLTGATVAITGGFLAGDVLNFANQNNITGSYNASTGVLTLSGSATLATYQAALDSITYSSANIDPTNGGADPTRTVTWSVSAGATNSAPVTSAIGVTTAVVPVLAGAGNTASYTQGGAAVAVDSALSVSDAGSTTLTGATVAITGGFLAGDILNFANQNNITGSYNASTGVLTLSGSATLATYQAALDSITYSSTNIDPTNGGADPTRTVTWNVSAGATNSAPVTSTIGVTEVAPVLAGAGNTASYTQGGAAVAVDGALSVSDTGSTTLSGATVAITGGFLAGDMLNFANQNNITGSYNASTGVLTLSGNATLATYQAALDSITYSSTNIDPTNGGADPTRTVTCNVSAGATNSAPVTSTIGVTAVAPVLAGAGNTASYTQGGAAVAVDSALTVSDTGSTTLSSATVAITTGFRPGDQLNFGNQNGITGSYNASTAVLTLSGSATLATYQAALDSITYSSTNIDPTNGGADPTRAVTWSVSAGATNSAPVTSTIGVTAVAPVLAGAGNTASYTQGGAAVAVDSALTVSDTGSTTLTGATIAITGGFLAGDILNLANQNGITGSYNASTGVLTLSGSASLAAYQAALDSITYSSANIDPTNGGADPTRTVTWNASAGATNSAPVTSTIGVTAQTSVSGTSVTTSFSGISDPTNWPPENGLAVGPANVVMVESSKIEWTNLTGGGAVNESLYTLFASLSASQRNSLLDARVAYDSVNKRFVVVAEDLGTNESNIDIAVSKDSNPNDGWYVGSVNSLLTLNGATTYADMPYLSVDGGNIYVSEGQYGSGLQGTQEWVFGDKAGAGGGIYNGGPLTTVASQVAPTSAGIARNVSDGQGLIYYVSVVPTGGQSFLTIQNYNAAANAFSTATTLALGNSDTGASSSDYTIAQKGTSLTLDAYDSRIASLAYSNGFLYGLSEVEPTGSSIPEIHWFKLNVSNPSAPTIAAQGDITGAAIGAGVGVFNGSLAVDAAGDMIVNFTASSANMFPADYYMVMPSGASSFGSPTLYQPSTSSYAQTTNASGAQRWGTYSTATADPNDPNGFWISNEYVTNSGITIPTGLSAWWDTVTAQVHVGPVTPPPVLAGAGNTASYTQGGAAVAVDSALSVSDAGSTTLTGATIAITGGLLAGDILNFANQNGITGSYNASSGILTLSGTASLATYQAALDSITFSTTNANPTTSGTDSVRAVTWNVVSGAQTSAAATSTIDVGQTYTLTTSRDTITAGAGNDTITAPSSSALNSGDSLNGGGGSNTLILRGGGTFNLGTPRVVSNIQTIDVLGSTTASTNVTLRSDLNSLAVALGASGQTETFSIAASSSASDIFEILSNFENVTVGGFSATGSTHDVLQFNAAAFGASLTAANQSADLAALLGDTKNNSSGSAVITDVYGHSVTLTGISTSTLSTAANAGDFRFV